MDDSSGDTSHLRQGIQDIQLSHGSRPHAVLDVHSLGTPGSSLVQAQEDTINSSVFLDPPITPAITGSHFTTMSPISPVPSSSTPVMDTDGIYLDIQDPSGLSFPMPDDNERTLVPDGTDADPYRLGYAQAPPTNLELLSHSTTRSSLPVASSQDIESDVVPGEMPLQETGQPASGAMAHQYNIQPRSPQAVSIEENFTELGKEEFLKKDDSMESTPRRPQQATSQPNVHPQFEMHQDAAAIPAGSPVDRNTYAMAGGGITVYNFGNVGNVQIGTSRGTGPPAKAKNVFGPSPRLPPPPQPARKKIKSSLSCGPTHGVKTKRLMVPRRMIRPDDLDFVANHAGKNWRHLGRKLGFSSGQLDIFENDYSGLHEQIFAMLERWVSGMESVPFKDLVRALVDAGCIDVATKLTDKEREDNSGD